jgi:hypothetical protein
MDGVDEVTEVTAEAIELPDDESTTRQRSASMKLSSSRQMTPSSGWPVSQMCSTPF